METFLDDILQEMKKGRTKRAFKIFEDNIDSFSEEEQRSISVLESRFNRINKEVSSGFTESSDARSELIRIDHGIFDIVSNFGKAPDLEDDEDEDRKKDAKVPVRKILFLASNPTDTGKLRLGAELRDIEEGLKLAEHRDSFELESRFAVRAKDLSRAMLEEEPQIIHFSGHGVLLKESEGAASGTRSLTWEEDEDDDKLAGYSGGIALEDNEGKAKIVAATALGGLFELFGENIECVFLNACYSDAQANEIIKHVPFVIGMNTAVPDETAIAFATGFYDALGAGKDIEFSFKLAKNRIALEGMPGADIPVLRDRSLEE
ncbi:MAG: CHAT domain-containing protein [Bacteroidota bacterium]